MTAPTLTCETCEIEVIYLSDPGCIQQGGMDVMCAACRERAWASWVLRDGPAGVGDLNLPKRDQRGCEALREAYRIKRGWRA